MSKEDGHIDQKYKTDAFTCSSENSQHEGSMQ